MTRPFSRKFGYRPMVYYGQAPCGLSGPKEEEHEEHARSISADEGVAFPDRLAIPAPGGDAYIRTDDPDPRAE